MPLETSFPLPLVGVMGNLRPVGKLDFHMAADPYIQAVAQCAKAVPLIIPALGAKISVRELAMRLDGLLITGSRSNIEPKHYDDEPRIPGDLHDPARDATILPLIRAAVELGVPFFGICRGLQELNVALGGSLYQTVHAEPGYSDHRSRDEDAVDIQFAPVHPVKLTEGGLLSKLLDRGELQVNSLHGQGIKRLAKGLTVEAKAPDGLVEAVRVENAKSFALGVQWHPEWLFPTDAPSQVLFAAFGQAVAARAAARGAATGAMAAAE